MKEIITDRKFIANEALEKIDENDDFRIYLQKINTQELDRTVHAINATVTPQIDCTECGGCCRQLMINVTPEEKIRVADHLDITPEQFQQQYLEESMQGNFIMNSIPCHFLADSKCSIYEERFTECRGFPHLHENNFKGRLFGTLIHYAMCPIIYNVVEELKEVVGFKESTDNI